MIQTNTAPTLPENPGEKHIACVVLVDTSGSMNFNPITELNKGLKTLEETLKNDLTASGCADVAVISFDSTVKTVTSFTPAVSFQAPELTAGGLTCMNEAIITGLDILEERKMLYRQLGTPYFRPWMFLMTDGAATDTDYQNAALQRLQEAITDKKVTFWAMGIGDGADIEALKKYTNGGPVFKASANNFKEAFVWLSSSMSAIGGSIPGQKTVPIAPPPFEVEI